MAVMVDRANTEDAHSSDSSAGQDCSRMQCSSCDLAFLHPAYPHTPSAISDHIVSEMGAKRPSLKSFINKPLRQFEGQLHPFTQRVECAGQYSNAGAPGLSVGRHSSEPSHKLDIKCRKHLQNCINHTEAIKHQLLISGPALWVAWWLGCSGLTLPLAPLHQGIIEHTAISTREQNSKLARGFY